MRRCGYRVHDLRLQTRLHLRGGDHPAGEVGFEAQLVRVAFGGFFAILFKEDVGGVGERAGEEILGAVEDALGSRSPDGRGAAVGGRGYVGHDGGAEEHRGDVVGPLVANDAGAVPGVVGAVVDIVAVAVYQSDPCHPVIRLLGPVAVRAVSSVSSQARGELEEGAVGNAGFVVESGVFGVELPL